MSEVKSGMTTDMARLFVCPHAETYQVAVLLNGYESTKSYEECQAAKCGHRLMDRVNEALAAQMTGCTKED